MNKKLVLPIYIVVEVIYYFTYLAIDGEPKFFALIWIICGLVNTYLLYVISPDYLKRSMKRKSIGLKILFYFVLVFIGFIITNAPVELILDVPLTSM